MPIGAGLLLAISAGRAASSAKSGVVTPDAFSGSPLKAVVSFGHPFPDENYAVTFNAQTDGSRSFSLSAENKTPFGFVISLQTNEPVGLVDVEWQAVAFPIVSGYAPTKSGVVLPGIFTGSPLKAAVNFAYAFPSNDYALTFASQTLGTGSFSLNAESKTKNGFVISLQSNELAALVSAEWHAYSFLNTPSEKSGVIAPEAFTGSPKKTAVIFSSPFPDNEYAITLGPITTGSRSLAPNIEDKTKEGFVLNLQVNSLAELVEIGWYAMSKKS